MTSHRAKPNHTRVCTEIPTEVNEIFAEYERRTSRKVNKSLVMKKALLAEAEAVKKEMEGL